MHVFLYEGYQCGHEKTRQEVIQLKTMISLTLGKNVGFGEWMIVARK